MNKLIFACAIFFTLNLLGQGIRLQGKVTDIDGNSIAYASVAVVGTAYGTVSNLKGKFDLIVRDTDAQQQVAISFVGYQTSYISIDTSYTHLVVLTEKDMELPSAFVLGFEAKDIIARFIENKALNYPSSPVVYKMFLREHERTTYGNDIYLSELLVDYLRYNYTSSKKDKVKVVKGRNLHYINFDSLGYVQPSGGLFDIRHDLVKYPADFIDKSKSEKYNYEIESVYEENGKPIYKLKFSPIAKKSKYEGFLYVEGGSFALLKAEVSYDQEGMEWLNASSWSADMDWKSMQKTVTYKKDQNNKYHISEIIIEGRGESYTLNDDIISLTELVTVNTETKEIQENTFSVIDKFVAISNLEFKNTPNFWEGNNYIKREDDLSSVNNYIINPLTSF